ncbi:Membrane-anchored ubiquitin-fold protein 3 [Glycine soja]
MPEEEVVELKFRLYDGSDIGPFRYSPASTIAMLKDRIFADWPKGKTQVLTRFSRSQVVGLDKKIIPKAANDIKLISAGKILENHKTVGQCRVPFGELPKGVITMHVVVQPSLLKAKTEKKVDEVPRKHICACSIL